MSTNDRHSLRVRRQRLRRAAERQGLVLAVSLRRDPRALDFQRYALGPAAPAATTGPEYTLTLDEVEARLTGDDPDADDEHAPAA